MAYSKWRREALKKMAASGALGAAGLSGLIAEALAKGDIPPGVNQLEGTATVNGRAAQVGTPVALGSTISTGQNSRAVIVVGKDAFLMRAHTVIEIQGNDGVLSELGVATGRVLSVFAKKPVAIKAATASIGIRGTGAYLEISPEDVYFCLCYGEAVVAGPNMADKLVKTTHHESPLLLDTRAPAMTAEPGPFRNHSDDELIMLEALCGREPPFMKNGTYPAGKYG
jgi:hypothetical protein